MAVTFDPPVKEMNVTRTAELSGEEIALKFVQPADFDDDEYPIEHNAPRHRGVQGLP